MISGSCARFGSVIVACTLTVLLSGCGVDLGLPDGDGDDADRQRDDVGVDSVLVAFVNLTSVDVDTEFYASNEEMADVEAELFVPANRIQVGIGVAGTGILLSGTDDSIEVPCTDDLVLGTTGGTFKDPDLGTSLGTGDVRILSEGLVFDCGATLTFTYSEDNGVFTVDIL